MNIYVVYDKKTGRIVHTAARYVLGNDDPISCSEEEILSLTQDEVGAGIELGIARVPDDFDIRNRTRMLEIDVKKGMCRTRKVKKPTLRKARKDSATEEKRSKTTRTP